MKSLFKKPVALILAICVFCSIIPSTFVVNAEDELNLKDLTTFTFDGDSVTVSTTDTSDKNYEVVIYNDADSESTCPSTTDESGNTVFSLPDGSDGQLLVAIKKKGGSYVFQGSGNGAIAVKKEAANNADLYLNGLNLSSSFTSVLVVKKDSEAECIIHVVDSTTNTLTDNARNNEDDNTDNLAAENAVMKFKNGSNVTITGNGTLNVVGNARNGIKANNLLTIDGNVNLNITAPNNGVNCENSITIKSGNLVIESGGDGIKSSPDVDAEIPSGNGDVLIENGTFDIIASGDGIKAYNDLIINNGSYNINSAGDAVHSDSSISINGGDINLNADGNGIYCNGDAKITGGDILVFGAASDDLSSDKCALNFSGSCVISGGTILAAGSSKIAKTPSDGSQAYILHTDTVDKGKAINILNGEGKPVYSTEAVKQVNYIIFSSGKVSDAYTFSITDEMLIKDSPVTPSEPTVKKPGTKNPSSNVVKTTRSTTRSAGAVAKDKKTAQKAMKQAKLTSLKIKSKSKKKINVSWKKIKKAKGYQVQVSAKKNFKKIIFKKDVKKTKLTIKNKKIKSKKTYFVRVRAYATYKNVNNKTVKVFSKWNKQIRKVKIK